MKKLVSVLMSTKDTKKEFLIKSIESILKQTYKYFEFIIICDGGLNDYNIVKNIKDSRIKIITHEKSIGLTKSLNEGIKYCSGEYIARMDSDDYSLKNRLKKQVEFLENNSDYDICSSFTRNFGKNKKFNITLFNDNEWIKSQLFVNNIISHPAIMIRKSFLLNNKINYNEFFVYSQDYELWCRCKNKTKIFIIPSILLLYRVHDSQISTAKILEQRKYKNEIIMKNFNELNLEKSESNMDCIEFLNNISLKKCDEKTFKRFIDDVLNKNKIVNIYDSSILRKTLYNNFFYCYFLKYHKLISILEIFKNNIFTYYLLKKILKLKFIILLFFERVDKYVEK